MTSVCANCGAEMTAAFCPCCGQKRFVEDDRRFGHLLHQFFASATDLDGRVWRTLRALLFQPGLLSREYMAGRRARWLSPTSLFLAVSVVYFLAPLHGGDLTPRFGQQVTADVRALALAPGESLTPEQRSASGQVHSPVTSRWVMQRVRERDAAARAASHGARGYTVLDYRRAYEAHADEVSKALIVLHVPFAALALTLVFMRRKRYFAEHFVFGLHYLTFWIVALQVVAQAMNLSQRLPPAWMPPEAVFDVIMRVLLPVYAILAVRRAYGVGWIASIVAAAAMLAAIVFGNLYVYRAVQFVATFALT